MSRTYTRRTVLTGAGALAASGLLGDGVSVARAADIAWDDTFDVVVVGGGAAGASAALHARDAGASVVLLEKLGAFGGTAAKSVGGLWVPNNRFLRAAGLADTREACLRYMVRLSHPTEYRPEGPPFGAPPDGYALLEAYYDHCARVLHGLEDKGVLRLGGEFGPGVRMPDYYAHLPENATPAGRALVPLRPDGSVGNGAELMRQLRAGLDARKVPVRTRHRVRGLVADPAGAVTGVVAERRDGASLRIGARGGVVFASGGFTHNPDLRRNFLKGPVFGGCATPGSEGDFIPIAGALGAQFGNMANAWWCQIPLEQALENPSVPTGLWTLPGDSMLQVNAAGRRFANEKFVYNERTQAQFAWDPVRGAYPNLLAFMIYDARTAREFAGYAPLPQGGAAPWVLSAPTLAALARALAARVATLAPHTGGARLAPDFAANLETTVARFNAMARAGRDEDFGRGETPIEPFFHAFGPRQVPNPLANPTLHPLTGGPYHAVILVAGTLDTKGGPRTDTRARVLGADGRPIPGLYGAGNCIASPAGPAYWAGGATLGPAITFGALAAEHAVTRLRAAA
jgi:3-oxosteroid 1-dehydrogenase